jgi:2-iminobutanoate/2-iminopropanoate deaminase
MEQQSIYTPQAPEPVGPYSQAVKFQELIFLCGQVPINPATGQMNTGDIAAQTEQVMQNLQAVLQAAGSSFDRVLKTTIYLKDMNDFAAMNTVYGRYFTKVLPARSTVEVARLPRDAKVEIDLIAY